MDDKLTTKKACKTKFYSTLVMRKCGLLKLLHLGHVCVNHHVFIWIGPSYFNCISLSAYSFPTIFNGSHNKKNIACANEQQHHWWHLDLHPIKTQWFGKHVDIVWKHSAKHELRSLYCHQTTDTCTCFAQVLIDFCNSVKSQWKRLRLPLLLEIIPTKKPPEPAVTVIFAEFRQN